PAPARPVAAGLVLKRSGENFRAPARSPPAKGPERPRENRRAPIAAAPLQRRSHPEQTPRADNTGCGPPRTPRTSARARPTPRPQKPRWERWAARQDRQDREESRPPLDLIEHDQALQAFQSEQGILKPRETPRIFQIKHGDRGRGLLR